MIVRYRSPRLSAHAEMAAVTTIKATTSTCRGTGCTGTTHPLENREASYLNLKVNQLRANSLRGGGRARHPGGSWPSRRPFRVSETPKTSTFHGQGRENSGPICAGVNPNTVRAHVHVSLNGLAVDYDEAVIPFVVKKVLADPSEIRLSPLINFDARPNSGMHKNR